MEKESLDGGESSEKSDLAKLQGSRESNPVSFVRFEEKNTIFPFVIGAD